jgi:hypothetical protein
VPRGDAFFTRHLTRVQPYHRGEAIFEGFWHPGAHNSASPLKNLVERLDNEALMLRGAPKRVIDQNKNVAHPLTVT